MNCLKQNREKVHPLKSLDEVCMYTQMLLFVCLSWSSDSTDDVTSLLPLLQPQMPPVIEEEFPEEPQTERYHKDVKVLLDFETWSFVRRFPFGNTRVLAFVLQPGPCRS
eukprot:m.64638 g.64638  ORF g.64638 m.64638 type:complete len:109 (-) comp19563_c0_seq2:547-873(-)